MTTVVMGARPPDHFEPEAALSPQEQRLLRGRLEKIDYASYAANLEVIRNGLGRTGIAQFEALAVSAAGARARWVAAALAVAAAKTAPSAQQIQELAALRSAFEELSEAYEALRRMVERGYLSFQT